MTSSLRDALRASGALDQFKTVAKPERTARPQGPAGKSPRGRRGPGPQRPGGSREDMDLAKAYALRAQSEQREREARLQAEREAAERRRVQRERVEALLAGHTCNRDDAEQVRNFEYGGKIRRVYVTDEQLSHLNEGRLGVVQVRGRYLLVAREVAEQVAAVDAHAVALLVDPAAVDATTEPDAG